jgi:hypothetical protein
LALQYHLEYLPNYIDFSIEQGTNKTLALPRPDDFVSIIYPLATN